METKSMKRALSAVLGLSALLWTSTAYAAHPASVAGNWNAVGNQTTGTLAIVQAASAATCKPISGSIFGAGTTIQGSYCPSTGRIGYSAHRHTSRGIEYQHLHIGNLANQIIHHGIAMIKYPFADYPAPLFALYPAPAFVPKLIGMVIHI